MARVKAGRTDTPAGARDNSAAGGQASGSKRDGRVDHIEADAQREREQLTERLEDIADPLRDRLRRPVARVNHWWRWVANLKPYRTWTQFSHNDGNLRTAGMAYQSLFAIFAALWVGFSVAGIWLSGNPTLMNALVDIINTAVPGLIAVDGSDGVISEQALQELGPTFGWTSLIALIGLLWTAIAWLYYTRQAVRAMFDLDRDERNYALQKVSDFGLAIVFGVILILSAAVSVVTTNALTGFLSLIGLNNESFWINFSARTVGFTISIALNFLALVAMYRVLSRVVIPWRSVTVGALLGAAAISGLSALSGLLIGAAGKNPLLATFAVFVGLLLWFNLVCRVILLAAAWIAVGMFDRNIEPRKRTPQQIAYERALAERNARLLIAQTYVQEAEAKAAAVHGFSKWFANRRLRDARTELARVEAEPMPTSPKKRSWWLADSPGTASDTSNARPAESASPSRTSKKGKVRAKDAEAEPTGSDPAAARRTDAEGAASGRGGEAKAARHAHPDAPSDGTETTVPAGARGQESVGRPD